LAERTRLRDVARGRNVPINAPQAPVQAAPKQVLASTAADKRVHVTIDSKKSVSQDEGDAETKHVASAEFGA
jgi:hypothetical protein